MIRVVTMLILILVVLLSVSCPKQQVSSSDQPLYSHLIHRPLLTNELLQENISKTSSGSYVWEDWLDMPLNIGVFFHNSGDNEGNFICKLPDGDIDLYDRFVKLYQSSYDGYLPEVPMQLFLGVREVVDGDIEKHCRLLQPSEQIEILNKVIEMNILTLKNPNYRELRSDYTDENIANDFIIVNIGTTFVSSLYPENKQTIDAFVAWFENKYYSTLNKPENKVTAFPWDCPDLPRPEKY